MFKGIANFMWRKVLWRNKITKILFVFVIVAAILIGIFGIQVSEGYRVGTISKVSVKGYLPFTKSVEATLMLEGTVHPWSFSSSDLNDMEVLEEFSESGGVARIDYKDVRFRWLRPTKTRYIFVDARHLVR
ncbi:MAG: hypothetical protein GY861_21315 [bacterium]|nr:hypothetical protein [bacterium]